MLCRIAKHSEAAKPIVWRPAGASSEAESREVQPAEIAALKRRIQELERARDTELAQARQEAFQEGLKQAREQAAGDVRASSERLAQILNELVAFKRNVRRDAEIELVKLSLAIARRILYRELVTDPEAIQGLVHAALQKLNNREISRVRVYPAGSDIVRSCLEQAGTAPAIQVLPDANLKIGDVIFETSLGELDASVETQLQEIQRGFADRLAIR